MTLEELSCKLECQDLIIRYFVMLDSGPRATIPDLLFTEDGTMVGPGNNVAEGAALRERFAQLPKEFVPVHPTMNILITPTGPNTADGTAYVVAYNIFGKVDDVLPRPMPTTPNRVGIVQFQFRNTASGWRISQFKPNVPFIDDGRT